ncbi:MAG: hypothetical protein ACTSQG_06065 [Promethearchaeota archaeon]
MAENSKKFLIIGILVIIAYILPWIILVFLHWMKDGFNVNNVADIRFIVSISVCGAALATSFHLWSRVPSLEGQLKKLFLLTGFTFIAIVIIFTYLIIDVVLGWQGYPTIAATLNSNISAVRFDFFGIEGLTATMPADSFLTFGLILFAISFYLFPIEKYVKQKVPWHTISMFICIAIIPVLVLAVPREFPGSEIAMSIITTIIVVWVLYNFLFLFYLYFSTGLKSPKGTNMRKASFMIGIGLLLIIFTWIAGWAINTGVPLTDLVIQMAFGALGIILFNYGFYIIKPD